MLVAKSQDHHSAHHWRDRGERFFQALLRQPCIQLELWQPAINEHVFIERHHRIAARLPVVPFQRDVARHLQQVGQRIPHLVQIAGAQQPQVGLLGQILYIDARANPPPQELEEASVPALPPLKE